MRLYKKHTIYCTNIINIHRVAQLRYIAYVCLSKGKIHNVDSIFHDGSRNL